MKKHKILVVEDDKNISKLLKYNLEKADYECNLVLTGEEALDILNRRQVDLIILDIMLPEMDGLEVCRIIKQNEKFRNIPIVMLTAKGEEVDRIVGLELGVDDYIVKPFSPRELILRIKAILKRGKLPESKKDILSVKDLTIDVPNFKATVKGKEVLLTAMEFKLLTILIERQGRVQTRERLLSDVWDTDSIIETRTIDTHIKRLREKLGKLGDSIETIRGIGYKFELTE
jgi:DNA-binding response OmpR family regulator